jgi:hypothetical protein
MTSDLDDCNVKLLESTNTFLNCVAINNMDHNVAAKSLLMCLVHLIKINGGSFKEMDDFVHISMKNLESVWKEKYGD